MLIFWGHILFLFTTRAGLHALMLKKLTCFLTQPIAAALFLSRIFASVWDSKRNCTETVRVLLFRYYYYSHEYGHNYCMEIRITPKI